VGKQLQLSTSFVPHLHWGIWRGQEIERWGDDIRLLDEWGFFDRPEPRLAHIRWTRHIESLARTMRIYHFQLGKATGSKDLLYNTVGGKAQRGGRRDRGNSRA